MTWSHRRRDPPLRRGRPRLGLEAQRLLDREAAEALLRLLPHARFVDVADACHIVAGDRNDVCSAAVLELALPLLYPNGVR